MRWNMCSFIRIIYYTISILGQLLPTIEAKVVDLETGLSLPANTDGEICIKSVCVS